MARHKVIAYLTSDTNPSSTQEQRDFSMTPPRVTVPLPEEVTRLHRVIFLERNQDEMLFTVEGQNVTGKGELRDVTVSLPTLVVPEKIDFGFRWLET